MPKPLSPNQRVKTMDQDTPNIPDSRKFSVFMEENRISPNHSPSNPNPTKKPEDGSANYKPKTK